MSVSVESSKHQPNSSYDADYCTRSHTKQLWVYSQRSSIARDSRSASNEAQPLADTENGTSRSLWWQNSGSKRGSENCLELCRIPWKKNMSDHRSSWKHWSMLTVCIGSGIEICCRRCWYICGCGLANNFRCRGSCCRGVDRCGSGSGRDSLSIGMLCKHWENKSRRTC